MEATRTRVWNVRVGDMVEGVDGAWWEVARKMAGPYQWDIQLVSRRGEVVGTQVRVDAYMYVEAGHAE